MRQAGSSARDSPRPHLREDDAHLSQTKPGQYRRHKENPPIAFASSTPIAVQESVQGMKHSATRTAPLEQPVHQAEIWQITQSLRRQQVEENHHGYCSKHRRPMLCVT